MNFSDEIPNYALDCDSPLNAVNQSEKDDAKKSKMPRAIWAIVCVYVVLMVLISLKLNGFLTGVLTDFTLAILVATLLGVILWKVPIHQAATSAGLTNEVRFDRENEARKTLATILGGLFLLAGLYSSIQTFNLARDGQITDRFSKGVEQLGSVDAAGAPKMDVRIGGIYSLGRIANDSERDHSVVMEILCNYVRTHAPAQASHANYLLFAEQPTGPTPDIVAILEVFQNRHVAFDKRGLDLSKADLSGADLSLIDLENANLHGAVLFKAYLVATNLSGAFLKDADVRGANMTSAIGLTDSQVSDMRGDFTTVLPHKMKAPEDWNKH
jgi:hypothetical protein